MTEAAVSDNPRVTVGGNNPPATPYDAIKAHIDDLEMEAKNHLDGGPVESQDQADAIAKLITDAREAKSAAEEQRKKEAKPFDDGKTEVQARYNPLCKDKTGKCDLIAEVAKKALAPWLQKLEDEREAAALAAKEEANRKATAAALAAANAAPDDLAGQTTARVLQEAAAEAEKTAARIGKQKAHAHGGGRAIGLTSVWTPTLTDPCAALRHYRERQPDSLKAWLQSEAEKDVRAGARSIPGFSIDEARVAV